MTGQVQPFASPVDVANRACQRVGARRILNLFPTPDSSKQAQEIFFCYDKLRRAELRRSPWRFATRRANLRIITATSYRFVPPLWLVGNTYAAGAIVNDANGVYWISNYGSNVGNVPGAIPTTLGFAAWWSQYFGPIYADLWDATVVYNAGDVVYKAGRTYYIAVKNTITAATDPASGAPWVAFGVSAVLASYGTGTNVFDNLLVMMQPAGVAYTAATNFAVQGRNRNMFPLPNGYLRPLGPDPKVENTPTLNTSGALQFADWQFEGNFIISNNPGPLLLRFIGDISNVPEMDDLFCEGLGCRIAYEVCETLTQSNIKLQAIGAAYQAFMGEARLINWLETGSTEPQEKEYELTRGPQGVTEGVPSNAMPGEQGRQGQEG